MNITQVLVKEVIASNSKKLHPQSWHDFQGSPEVQAINGALLSLGNPSKHGANLSDIVAEAKKFLDAFQ